MTRCPYRWFFPLRCAVSGSRMSKLCGSVVGSNPPSKCSPNSSRVYVAALTWYARLPPFYVEAVSRSNISYPRSSLSIHASAHSCPSPSRWHDHASNTSRNGAYRVRRVSPGHWHRQPSNAVSYQQAHPLIQKSSPPLSVPTWFVCSCTWNDLEIEQSCPATSHFRWPHVLE
jgi:hypothetical protein